MEDVFETLITLPTSFGRLPIQTYITLAMDRKPEQVIFVQNTYQDLMWGDVQLDCFLLQILKECWANNSILESVLREQGWKLHTPGSVSRSVIDFAYYRSHVILGASIFLHTYLRY